MRWGAHACCCRHTLIHHGCIYACTGALPLSRWRQLHSIAQASFAPQMEKHQPSLCSHQLHLSHWLSSWNFCFTRLDSRSPILVSLPPVCTPAAAPNKCFCTLHISPVCMLPSKQAYVLQSVAEAVRSLIGAPFPAHSACPSTEAFAVAHFVVPCMGSCRSALQPSHAASRRTQRAVERSC